MKKHSKSKAKTKRNRKDTKPVKRNTDQGSTEPEEKVDDGYDGYYDDVLPPDLDRAKEGMDKALIKQVLLVGLVVFVIISLCVALLYVL